MSDDDSNLNKIFYFRSSFDVKNTLKPTYKSPITGDFGAFRPSHCLNPGQILGPDATTCYQPVPAVS